MKKNVFVSLIAIILIVSCNSSQPNNTKKSDSQQLIKNQKDKDTTESKVNQDMGDAGGNLVKVESPDALVKFEQGYAMPKMTDGKAQSPVDIISSGAFNNPKQRIFLKISGTIIAVENLSHTIQVDFANGSFILVNGKSYDLKQLHFHTPSEHLVDGMTFPLEMHIVSKLNDSVKNAGSTYTVIGVLFKIGHENKFISEFLNSIPQDEGKEMLDKQRVNINDLFSEISNKETPTYFNYQGSLSTPPYTESVNWIIRKNIFEASLDQIITIEKFEGNNARHIHALNERKIFSE